jgi:hypothetical protein
MKWGLAGLHSRSPRGSMIANRNQAAVGTVTHRVLKLNCGVLNVVVH